MSGTEAISGHLYTAQSGVYGFDANCTITPAMAQSFALAGYGFAVRYVARVTHHPGDLTAQEAADILHAGLGLMVVQHVESAESWEPSLIKGVQYGTTAAALVHDMGLPPGTMIWCDLEGVSRHVSAQTVIDYCNAWHARVSGAGYLAGLYVGWHCGLTSGQLYRALRFTHFWSAYNLNRDEMPAVRGVQMRQYACGVKDRVNGCSIEFDVNRILPDALGGSPVVLAPERWPW